MEMKFKNFKMKPEINDYNIGDKLPYMYSRCTYTILDNESNMVLLVRNNIITYKGDVLGLESHNIPSVCIDMNMNKLEPGIVNRHIKEQIINKQLKEFSINGIVSVGTKPDFTYRVIPIDKK